MKLVFLDIDGVVNSDAYLAASPHFNDGKILQFKKSDSAMWLDPIAIALVNDLINRSEATVVLSSSWRIMYSPVEMTKLLQERGGTFTITTCTPQLQHRMSEVVSRGTEIKAYLKVLPEQPEAFVILDDHNDMLDLTKFLVRTTMKHGITISHVEKALKILNGDFS